MSGITGNWLAVVVGVYLISMVLYGHYKGFIRLAVSMASIIVTLFLVNLAMPQVTSYLKDNTAIHTMVESNLKKAFEIDQISSKESELPAQQRTLIEDLKLPKQLKDGLIENNNNEVYQILGVEAFTDYVASYLSGIMINIIGFFLLFILIQVILRILVRWLDIVARLPIISGLNKIAGALLGGLEGLIFLWIACLIVTALSGSEFGMSMINQIESSKWLLFLYDNNIFRTAIMEIVAGVM